MTSDRALALLEHENPIDEGDLPGADAAEALLLKERILLEESPRRPRARQAHGRRRLVGVTAAGVCLAAVSAVAALLVLGTTGGGPAVEDAVAAVKQAAITTAASADRSGTAVVRITHDGELWAGTAIRWNDDDIAASRATPEGGRQAGDEWRVVDGTFYGIDPIEGGWIDQGSPANIDPDSGTTPDEILAAVLEDVEGATLRRLGDSMTRLTTTRLDDGSTVYRGSVPAGQIARETGFKEGEHIRVFPFGYVAHGRAADPEALLDTAVTVGEDGLIRELAVTWGTWAYAVTYSDLGTTAPVLAPKNAKSLLKMRADALEEQQ
jgi:hypothetical protein